MEKEEGGNCMPASNKKNLSLSLSEPEGCLDGKEEEEEEDEEYMKLARLRELKERLGSPTDSIESDSSGQFDDAEQDSVGRRSRTVSSCSDASTLSLQETSIPLPDSSNEMIAKYASKDNLHTSPIALPDATGYFSLKTGGTDKTTSQSGDRGVCFREEEDEFGGFSAARTERETTPKAGTQRFTAVTEPSSTMYTNTGAHSYTSDMQSKDSIDNMAKSKPELSSMKSQSSKSYTPGSYSTNKARYVRTSEDSSDLKSSSVYDGMSSSRTARVQKELDDEYEKIMGRYAEDKMARANLDDDYKMHLQEDKYKTSSFLGQNIRSSGHTHKYDDDTSTSSSYSLRSRERLNEEKKILDSYSKEDLVKEILSREVNDKDRQDRHKKIYVVPGYGTLSPDRILTSPNRECTSPSYSSTGRSSPASDYSVKDYKSYIASRYGEDEAASIRDTTPQPYTVRYDSPSSPSDYDTPYIVRSASEASETPYYVRSASEASDISGDENLQYGAASPEYDIYNQSGRYSQGAYRPRSDYKQYDSGYSSTSSKRSSGYQSYGSDSSETYSNSKRSFSEKGPQSKYQYPSSGQYKEYGYQRDSSGKEHRGQRDNINYERSRQPEEPKVKSSVMDALSMLDEPIRNLVGDLLGGKDYDKNKLWDKHSNILKDDDFCKSFFTKDWGLGGSGGDEDTGPDFVKRRCATVKHTQTHIKPGRGDDPTQISQVVREEKVTDDMMGKMPRGGNAKDPHSSTRRDAGGYSKYQEYSPGYSREKRASDARTEERKTHTEHDGARGSDRKPFSQDRQNTNSAEKGKDKSKDTEPLFFTDFDDLIGHFKDLKYKSAFEDSKQIPEKPHSSEES